MLSRAYALHGCKSCALTIAQCIDKGCHLWGHLAAAARHTMTRKATFWWHEPTNFARLHLNSGIASQARMIACLDLEGVLVPEIWINVAASTGIDALRRTTRDEPDYDKLMRTRLRILDEHGLGLRDIQEVIARMGPLEGAREFVAWLRSRHQVIILSDTFYEFAAPLMAQLDHPCLFCNSLVVDERGLIVDYRLRIRDGKRKAVMALKLLNFTVVAAGDSYNDTTMLTEADAGILFRPPDNVVRDFPQFPATHTYDELRAAFEQAAQRLA